ncbi:MAG: AMP-binding protein, partial [Frankiaceae bacterium]
MPNFARDALSGAARVAATVRNAVEVARFGGLRTEEEPTPYSVVTHQPMYRLRRYLTDERSPVDGVPILLVPPLMVTAEVWDVSPATSAVRRLVGAGIDAWVIDFGSPEREAGGLQRTLADHVVAVSEAVDRIRQLTGHDVHLAGYSQGGMFCYQVAAYRRSAGLLSLVTFGSPVDLRNAMPFGLPEQIGVRVADTFVELINGRALPGWATRLGFRLLDPVKSVRQQVEFILALHDRVALLPRERQRQFLMGEGFIAWPGPALADFVQQFLVHNRLLQGGLAIGGRVSTLADITCPILYFVGTTDELAPAASVIPIRRAAPLANIYEASMPTGHFGLVVGSRAAERSWPLVVSWIRWREGLEDLPAEIVRIDPAAALVAPPEPNPALAALGSVAGAAGDAGLLVASSAARSVRAATRLGGEAFTQLPRLSRLGRTRPDTRLSLGLLLREQGRRAPGDVWLLYRDRAYTNAEADAVVDAVTHALLGAGVRQGERVGVLMKARPSAMAVVAALNRLGAVAVLLRPEGETAREIDLAGVARVVADVDAPDLPAAQAVLPDGAVHTFHLDEVAAPEGTLVLPGPGFKPPGWYVPNGGRAGDLAFILFSGEGAGTSANHVTNGRWALSALGTATSASLDGTDTVLSINPLHHPSGLLTSLGGAVAAGARLAIASAPDAATFWNESRRYGATVVSYTWAQLRTLTEAPPSEAERHHSIRLFLGSGMPPGLWMRVLERFSPARVLEFWVTGEEDVVLANISGSKPGAVGRPLPGSAAVRLARYDLRARRLAVGEDGFLVPAGCDEIGMLLARLDRPSRGAMSARGVMRGVFAAGDAWIGTDSLFRLDADGDYWLVDTVAGLIPSAAGVVASLPISNALSRLDEVDLAVTYGQTGAEGHPVVVAAVSLRQGQTLRASNVTAALAALEDDQRPAVVR